MVFAKWRLIDFVLGERPWAVDVNARPTTFIIGIARVMKKEIGELILQARFGGMPGEVQTCHQRANTYHQTRHKVLGTRVPEIPAFLWQIIYGLGKHTQPEGIKSVIFDLCSIRPFAAEELAKTLTRNKGWVRTSYLRPMLREGKIEYVRF